MSYFPKDKKKIQERIKRYERELRKQQERYGFIHDGAGKRYLLGPLYLVKGDIDGAIASFEWFEKTFPDDVGEPFQYLCWTLVLYLHGDIKDASDKLLQTMLKNLYLIPHLLGLGQEKLDIYHSSNFDEKEYIIDYAQPEIFQIWDKKALDWAIEMYNSEKFIKVRKRFIGIYKQLKTEPVGPKRSQLVEESSALEHLNFDLLE